MKRIDLGSGVTRWESEVGEVQHTVFDGFREFFPKLELAPASSILSNIPLELPIERQVVEANLLLSIEEQFVACRRFGELLLIVLSDGYLYWTTGYHLSSITEYIPGANLLKTLLKYRDAVIEGNIVRFVSDYDEFYQFTNCNELIKILVERGVYENRLSHSSWYSYSFTMVEDREAKLLKFINKEGKQFESIAWNGSANQYSVEKLLELLPVLKLFKKQN